MNDDRYDVNLKISKDEFISCGWKECLSLESQCDYISMMTEFISGARRAITDNRKSHGKILWLLADACSMRLNPDSKNEPFVPQNYGIGRISNSIDTFSDDDILFFSNIIDIIDNNLLKARLSDIVWSKKRSLGIQFALDAIDAYRKIPIDTAHWFADGCVCWERALSLTHMLGTGAGNRLNEIELDLLNAFNGTKKEENFFAIQICELILKYKICSDKLGDIALRLEQFADIFDSENNFYAAKVYYSGVIEIYKILKDKEWISITAKKALCFIQEAEMHTDPNHYSCIAATACYEGAIQVYRSIPRLYRDEYDIDRKISETQKKMNEICGKQLDEMACVNIDGVDIRPLIENSENKIKNKSRIEALHAFSSICPLIRYDDVYRMAKKLFREYPTSFLFQRVVLSRDGRVVAKCPGVGDDSDSQECAIAQQMIEYCSVLINVYVQAAIIPSLDIMHIEHSFTEIDFISFAQQSPLVPEGRDRLFAKALYAGYNYDFITAIHILVPQIEHMVRWHLKNMGIITSNIDKDGIETENSLNTLLDRPEAESILGKDLAFVLKMLLCSPSGPNIRNELAHGLIADSDCYSASAVYLWWLILKMLLNLYWKECNVAKIKSEQDDKKCPE